MPTTSAPSPSRAVRSPRRPALTALLVITTALTSGCFLLPQRTGGGGTASDEAGFRGTLTIESRSSFPICRLMLQTNDNASAQDVQMSAGDTASFEVTSDTIRLLVTECGAERSLYGHPMSWRGSAIGPRQLLRGLVSDRVVLVDEGGGGDPSARTLTLAPRPIDDWIFYTPHVDPQIASAVHEALQARASADGWTESVQFVLPLTDWRIETHPVSGVVTGRSVTAAGLAQWPDGHCSQQAFGFTQDAVGGSFSSASALRFDGTMLQQSLPCAALERARAHPAASRP